MTLTDRMKAEKRKAESGKQSGRSVSIPCDYASGYQRMMVNQGKEAANRRSRCSECSIVVCCQRIGSSVLLQEDHVVAMHKVAKKAKTFEAQKIIRMLKKVKCVIWLSD